MKRPSLSVDTARLRFARSDPLLHGAYSLMVNIGVTTGVGLFFWTVAVRLYSPSIVGRDAALIAAMVELTMICQLNLVNAVIRFLPRLERHTSRGLFAAYALSGMAAGIVGTAFVLAAPMISDQFRFLKQDSLIAVLYVLAQVLWTWFTLEDAALTALRKAHWVPVENGTFGLLKLGALPLLVTLGAKDGVFLASVLPVIFLVIPVNVFLFRTAIPEHLRTHRQAGSLLHRLSRRRLLCFMAQDYGATVMSKIPSTALPVIVVALLSSRANAYFYIPYTIVVAFTLMISGACTALVVEGALMEDRIHALAKRLVRRFMLILVPGVIFLVAAAPLILLPFGAKYVHEGTLLLRILAVGCLFRAASILFIAIARVQGKGLRILAVEGIEAALLLSGAVVLSKPLGLQGIALSWVGATGIVGLAVLPSLVRFLRSHTLITVATEAVGESSHEEIAAL